MQSLRTSKAVPSVGVDAWKCDRCQETFDDQVRLGLHQMNSCPVDRHAPPLPQRASEASVGTRLVELVESATQAVEEDDTAHLGEMLVCIRQIGERLRPRTKEAYPRCSHCSALIKSSSERCSNGGYCTPIEASPRTENPFVPYLHPNRSGLVLPVKQREAWDLGYAACLADGARTETALHGPTIEACVKEIRAYADERSQRAEEAEKDGDAGDAHTFFAHRFAATTLVHRLRKLATQTGSGGAT